MTDITYEVLPRDLAGYTVGRNIVLNSSYSADECLYHQGLLAEVIGTCDQVILSFDRYGDLRRCALVDVESLKEGAAQNA